MVVSGVGREGRKGLHRAAEVSLERGQGREVLQEGDSDMRVATCRASCRVAVVVVVSAAVQR